MFETMYKGSSDMVLLVHPGMVKMKSNWKAGELMIAPATSRVERKEVPGAIPCGKFDLGKEALEVLYLAPMFTAPMSSQGFQTNSHGCHHSGTFQVWQKVRRQISFSRVSKTKLANT